MPYLTTVVTRHLCELGYIVEDMPEHRHPALVNSKRQRVKVVKQYLGGCASWLTLDIYEERYTLDVVGVTDQPVDGFRGTYDLNDPKSLDRFETDIAEYFAVAIRTRESRQPKRGLSGREHDPMWWFI